MFKIQKEIHFCYAHRLLNHPGKCRHIHGHNVRAIITLSTEELNASGMVADFSEIERQIKPWIDQELDHNFLLAKHDPLIPTLKSAGERYYSMDAPPTAENIAFLIYQQTKSTDLPVESITLWETCTASAHYCPSR